MEIEHFLQKLELQQQALAARVPPKADAQSLADDLFHFLFPVLTTDGAPARARYAILQQDLQKMLVKVLADRSGEAEQLAHKFWTRLPAVYDQLLEDAEAILQFDPAATCLEEVIATYPGFYAIANYRIANILHRLKVPFLPRIFAEYVHGKTGIDIHPGATIGHSFFIDHGTGVVIGATAVIGNNVKIYQGVTLGALQVDKSLANVKRHPTIEDNCVLYANCTILGGRTTVGHSTVVGGNAWLTESVAPYSIVVNQSQSRVRSRGIDEPINFVI